MGLFGVENAASVLNKLQFSSILTVIMSGSLPEPALLLMIESMWRSFARSAQRSTGDFDQIKFINIISSMDLHALMTVDFLL
jgi:hypothetical protein